MNDETRLMLCSAQQSAEMDVLHYLDQGADINGQDEDGLTLLHWFSNCFNKTSMTNPKYAQQIFAHNPNPFIKNNEGLTPRMYAIYCGSENGAFMAQLLSAYETEYLHNEIIKSQQDLEDKLHQRDLRARDIMNGLLGLVNTVSFEHLPQIGRAALESAVARGETIPPQYADAMEMKENLNTTLSAYVDVIDKKQLGILFPNQQENQR